MKLNNKIKSIFIGFSSVMLLGSCSDFLEKYPLDAMGDNSYFTKETDLKYYMNGVIGGIVRNNDRHRWDALNSANDDCVAGSPSGTLMHHSSSGMAGNTSGTWNNSYAYIRKINYFLENSAKLENMTSVGNHYLGEGYYLRAQKYFDLLQTYGGVPYIDKVLNVDSKEMYNPRESRSFITDKILADLDSAIELLSWRGVGEAKAGRINKEMALVLKTRVALFEGSWEYYHGKKKTPFAVSGSNGQKYLQQVESAAKMLIEKHGNNLYKGAPGSEYFDLFNQKEYEKIPGAFFYKSFSRAIGMVQWWFRNYTEGFGVCLTKSAVDSYLMRDGKPIEVSSIKVTEETMNELCVKKDPRLEQTMWCPSKGKFSEFFPGHTFAYSTSYPGIIQSQLYHPAYTGYRIWKGTCFDQNEFDNGEVDDLIMRYEEGLLNFAEAKAILGTITQEDLDHSINYIRARVGMPGMNLNEINSWDITYSPRYGYDPSAENIVNEIRRERRVELILEGNRFTDIKRWAMLDDVFNGWIPLGAKAKEFVDYWNDEERLKADGFEKPFKDVRLTKGGNYNEIDGYINPFFKHADFKDASSRGYYVEPTRDYLDFVPREEINIYKDKANVTLEQNPGWF